MSSFNILLTVTVDPDVMLTHNLVGGNRAYDRQVVTFRCVITGVVRVINWRSEQYIGTGGDVLQLASADPPGQTASNSRNPTTVATLVSTSRSASGGVTTTVSELQITASSQYPSSSISCANNGDGPVSATVFQTLFGKEDCVTLFLIANYLQLHAPRGKKYDVEEGNQWIPYSVKFLRGAKFRIFHGEVGCCEIGQNVMSYIVHAIDRRGCAWS
jgi:hypothetical protein